MLPSSVAAVGVGSGRAGEAAGSAIRFTPSAIRFSGAVLIWTHNALSPLEVLAVSSMVMRASLAGILLDKVRSKSSSALPGLSGHLNPFMSISPAPAGSLIVSGLQASPVCEKMGMKPSLATTLYVAAEIASSTLPLPERLVFVPRATDVGDNDVMCPWVEESPQSDQLSLIVPPPEAAAPPMSAEARARRIAKLVTRFKETTWLEG